MRPITNISEGITKAWEKKLKLSHLSSAMPLVLAIRSPRQTFSFLLTTAKRRRREQLLSNIQLVDIANNHAVK